MQVQTWLEGLFGEGNVPEYEIRSDTLDVLQWLRERHERSCRVTSELLADAERKKREYECEGTAASCTEFFTFSRQTSQWSDRVLTRIHCHRLVEVHKDSIGALGVAHFDILCSLEQVHQLSHYKCGIRNM